MTPEQAARKDLAQLEVDFKVYTDRGDYPSHDFLDYYYTKKAKIEHWLVNEEEENEISETSRTRSYERGYFS